MPAVVKVSEELRPREGRVPPNDLDAEAAVLSAIFLRPTDFDLAFRIVQNNMFYADANKMIFEAFEALNSANELPDPITVAQYLRRVGKLERAGGMAYLTDLTDKIPDVANVAAYASIVKDKWQARQLILRSQKFIAEAYTGSAPSIELVQAAEGELGELASIGIGSELVTVGEVLSSEVALRNELRARGETGIGVGVPTGYPKLDKMTGGLQNSDLIVVAGRPGMGKTTWVMNVIANVARPTGNDNELPDGAAFFSLEMPRQQIAIRFACAEALVSLTGVRNNYLRDEDWEKFQRTAEDLQRFPIWIDDSPTLTVLDIRARVRKLQRDIAAGRTTVQARKLAVIAVDYLQLMRGIRLGGDNRENEVASLSRDLKALAKSLNLPVVAVSQLNRGPEKNRGPKDRRPELSDLRESGAIEQDADTVIFIYRPSYYDREADPLAAEALLKKQRNGATGTIPLSFQGENVRFFERAEDTYDDLAGDFEDR